MDKTDIIFLSYYTKNTPYEEIAHKRIIPSFEEFGLPYVVGALESKGSWKLNTCIKPDFIHQFLSVYDKVVWIDCDATIEQYPNLFFNIDKPIALHELDWDTHYKNGTGKKELLSGTVYLTKEAIEIVKFWKTNAAKFPTEAEALEHYIRVNNIDYYNLPSQYCTVVDREYHIPKYIKDPVIVHWQASRMHKRSIK